LPVGGKPRQEAWRSHGFAGRGEVNSPEFRSTGIVPNFALES
jgi:hypothetical protein